MLLWQPIFSLKTWRRAFHRGNLLLALSSCIASNNIAVKTWLQNIAVFTLSCVASKHHMSSIFIACRDIRYPSYVSTIHSKATWQGYTRSASHVVTYRRQVMCRSYGSKLHISKLRIKATCQGYMALLLSKVLGTCT